MRAAISLFSDVVRDNRMEMVKAELRWLGREFAPARDLDSLLIFRVLYFMLPLCAAVLLLSAREGWIASRISVDKACPSAVKDPRLS